LILAQDVKSVLDRNPHTDEVLDFQKAFDVASILQKLSSPDNRLHIFKQLRY